MGESDKPIVSASQHVQPVPQMLEVGSTVEFGDPLQYGVIKSIEHDPDWNKEVAKVEMVSHLAIL